MKYFIMEDNTIGRSKTGKPKEQIVLKNVFSTKREAMTVRNVKIRKKK